MNVINFILIAILSCYTISLRSKVVSLEKDFVIFLKLEKQRLIKENEDLENRITNLKNK